MDLGYKKRLSDRATFCAINLLWDQFKEKYKDVSWMDLDSETMLGLVSDTNNWNIVDIKDKSKIIKLNVENMSRDVLETICEKLYWPEIVSQQSNAGVLLALAWRARINEYHNCSDIRFMFGIGVE